MKRSRYLRVPVGEVVLLAGLQSQTRLLLAVLLVVLLLLFLLVFLLLVFLLLFLLLGASARGAGRRRHVLARHLRAASRNSVKKKE